MIQYFTLKIDSENYKAIETNERTKERGKNETKNYIIELMAYHSVSIKFCYIFDFSN